MITSNSIKILLFLSLINLSYLYFGFPDSFVFFFTNNIIITLSSFAIFYKPRVYFSLFKLFYLFYFLFFGVSPYLAYINNIVYWGGKAIDSDYYIIANLIIIATMVVYFMVYQYYNPKINIKKLVSYEYHYRFSIAANKKKILLFLFILALIGSLLIFKYRGFDFMSLFFRETIASHSKMEFLFVAYILIPLPVITTLIFIYIQNITSYKFGTFYKYLFIFIFIIFVSPTSTARFFAATIYLALLLSTTKIFYKPHRLQFTFLFGLFILFPMIDKFRHMQYFDQVDWSIDFHYITTGSFDAYQNFARLLSYDSISYGYQLLGSIGFFIPRSIWKDKPWGSGNVVGNFFNLDLTNLSMPLIGEGYINFGVIGSVIFIIILALVSKFLDYRYWKMKKHFKSFSFENTYYLFLGLSFFMLRGDLMSSFAYTVTIIGLYTVIFKVLLIFAKVKF